MFLVTGMKDGGDAMRGRALPRHKVIAPIPAQMVLKKHLLSPTVYADVNCQVVATVTYGWWEISPQNDDIPAVSGPVTLEQ